MAICYKLSNYQKQHKFPLYYPYQNNSPIKTSQISKKFKHPPISPNTTKNTTPNYTQTSSTIQQNNNPLKLTLIKTNNLP